MKHKQFGEYIRLMRKDKKMSGPAFGKLIGVTKSYISQIENGNTAPPSDEVIYRMSGVLNEDVDFLFSLAGRISSDLIPIILKNPVIIHCRYDKKFKTSLTR